MQINSNQQRVKHVAHNTCLCGWKLNLLEILCPNQRELCRSSDHTLWGENCNGTAGTSMTPSQLNIFAGTL